MKTDSDIKRDVEAELKWDPDIDATDIAVAVKDGVVTLTGFVKSYTHKWQAESDAKRVGGVKGVASDIEVRLPAGSERPDPEIARDAVAALKNELPFSSENMKVVVRNGWVTLEGTAEWNYQRTRAEDAVRRVKGIKGVTNSDRNETARHAVRNQEQDRGSLSPQCGSRRETHHRRDERRRGDSQRQRSVLGRARGGRAGGLAGAGRRQG
jgi:osmotically-inducible protein OsmY